MNGFFQIQRRFFSHWLWKDDDRIFSRAEAFLDLLQLAAFTRTKRIVGSSLIELDPGQIVASERFLAGRWKWSTTKVRAYLTLLEADKMVGKEIKQGISIITLCNYARYASGGLPEKAQINHPESRGKAGGKQIEEGEEGVTPTAPDGASSCPVPEIRWNAADGFMGITDDDRTRWAEAFPALNIGSQLARASEWLRANPAKRKKAIRRFITNWMARAQEKGGDSPSNPPSGGSKWKTD